MTIYKVETYDSNSMLISNQSKTLMQLRVFCEQEMYLKLNSGEFGIVLIQRGENSNNKDKPE